MAEAAAQPEPTGGVVYVPDAERANYVRRPGEIVIGDAQLAGLARILGPAIERVVARKRALKQSHESELGKTG
jgi:hypothetical protein